MTIRDGAWIVTDTQMGKSGINRKNWHSTEAKCAVLCLTKRLQTWQKNREQRARLPAWSVRPSWIKKLIFAIGNAPTALIRLYEMIQEGRLKTRADHWSASGVCQCGTVQRTDPVTERHTVYRGKRTKRRKQYRSMYLQCVVVYDG